MVDVCCQQVKRWSNSWAPAIDWSNGTYQQRALRGLHHIVKVNGLLGAGNHIAKVLPQAARSRLGIVSPSQVNAVFDVSGFAYSDQWGVNPAKAMLERVEKRQKQGERYFLLPQAFGPFENSEVRSVVRSYLDHAELVYVRDRISLRHVHDLMGENNERIKLCPDFTCLANKSTEGSIECDIPYVCIVPNCRMVDPRHGDSAGKYEEYLLMAVNEIHSLGWKVVLLNHEGKGDLELVERLASQIRQEIIIVRSGGARELKAILGGARAVVASRFHAIVSSLSQGIPVIGTGWSHKYEELFDEFEISELLWSLDCDSGDLSSVFESLARDSEYEVIRTKILAGALRYRRKAQELWSSLENTLNS